MIIGSSQMVQVLREVPGGFMVGGPQGEALLPNRHINGTITPGQKVKVFVYPDKSEVLIATMELPFAEAGQFACLEVLELSPHGAFLDWGLERDLLVPFALQHTPLEPGQKVVVAIDLDEQNRIYASSSLSEFFEDDASELQPGQKVSLMVFAFTPTGVRVIVDGRWQGLLYRDQVFQRLTEGQELEGWVLTVRGDGRVDVTLQAVAKAGADDATEALYDKLVAAGGFLPVHDKSSPDVVARLLKMSKKRFKKALGALYKARRVTIEPGGVRLIAPE